MSEILHTVHIRGKHSTWCVGTYITRETAEDWRGDGIEVYEVVNTIPEWIVDCGLPVGWWCVLQDLFHFRNPWRK